MSEATAVIVAIFVKDMISSSMGRGVGVGSWMVGVVIGATAVVYSQFHVHTLVLRRARGSHCVVGTC